MTKLFALLIFVTLLPVSAVAQNAGWKQSWEETLAAAKEEGKVVVSGPPSQELRKVLPAAFKARYGITMEYLGGRSTESAARMRAERQAGIHSIDVVFAGIQSMALTFHREKMLQPLKPALQLPEVVDGKKWKKGKLWFADPEEQYILRLANTVTTMFHINTREVKPGEMRSVKDLLNPKWKGKIALQDPTIPGSGSNQAAHLYFQHGEDFVKQLYVDQKPMISRDTRQITDGLARGIYPIIARRRRRRRGKAAQGGNTGRDPGKPYRPLSRDFRKLRPGRDHRQRSASERSQGIRELDSLEGRQRSVQPGHGHRSDAQRHRRKPPAAGDHSEGRRAVFRHL